ncbi:septum formation initiator family protein [Lacrimispora sp.]|jgi:cell division protein DivIC|uniref:septum formation initiator family protein n=1 Tax=Lacrimispora sp. TaxID=2719234 RepID=UPI0028A5932B|nr:septum formation initiator family protein [Lacrimispora sp.]
MSVIRKTRRKRKDKWGNRMALIGITFVVFSLAVTVTIKGTSLKGREREYAIRLENLQAQVDKEQERAKKLEDYRVYVQTKQYIEEVAKQKLGLVKPDEILLKPSQRQ